MKQAFQDTFYILRYEATEALRTRLFQLAITIYLGILFGCNLLFIFILHLMERSLAEQLGVEATWRPGAMLGSLLQEGELPRLFSSLMGGDRFQMLLNEPPLALWSSVCSMALLPLLLLFSSAASVSAEVSSLSLRYLLCRTDRLYISLGKWLGQVFFGAVAALMGVGMSWLMGMLLMRKVPPMGMILALLHYLPGVIFYSLAAAGMGMSASQMLRSPNLSRLLALGIFVANAFLYVWLDFHTDSTTMGRFFSTLMVWIPFQDWSAFWSYRPLDVLAASGRCIAIGAGWFSLGYLFFQRKDL